jgi:hypothetical protein
VKAETRGYYPPLGLIRAKPEGVRGRIRETRRGKLRCRLQVRPARGRQVSPDIDMTEWVGVGRRKVEGDQVGSRQASIQYLVCEGTNQGMIREGGRGRFALLERGWQVIA